MTDVRHELIPLSDPERWHAALAGVDHGFAHTHGHVQAFALSSDLPTHLYHCRADGKDAVCVIAERHYRGEPDIFTPYGFGGFAASGAIPGFALMWREFALSRGWVCGYLQGNPLFLDPLLGEEGGVAINSVFVLDLTSSEEELLAHMARGRRRQILSLGRGGVAYGDAGHDAIEFVVREAPAFFSSRSAASLYQFSDATWRHLLTAQGILTIEARQGSELVAVTIFGLAGKMADHLFYILAPAGRGTSAGLLWTGIKRLKAMGCRTLNLGGGIRRDDDVAQFKRLCGATEVPFAAARHVYRPRVFEELCRSAEADTQSDYFPPYHAPKRS
jgi:hypothetical protein